MTKNIPEQSTALIRRGEQRSVVYTATAIVFTIIIAVIVFMITSMSTNTRDKVLNQQEDYTFASNMIVKGLFSIVSIRFADVENASCTFSESYERPVSITMRFNAYEVPDSCSFFMNNVLFKSERRLEPDCRIACDFKEFNRQFSLGIFDYRDNAIIKVCCDSICLEKKLDSICNQN